MTLVMFPVLVVMYVRLAIAEEHDTEEAFGGAWREYAAVTPRFVPHYSKAKGDRTRPVSNRDG